MLKFKIVGGQVADETAFVKPDAAGTQFKSLELVLFNNQIQHVYHGEWSSWPKHFLVTSQLETAELVTEENKVNFVGAAGWGAVGGLLTGGVGLLAGALLGGRGKKAFAAVRFSDGTQFLVEGKPKDVAKLTFSAAR